MKLKWWLPGAVTIQNIASVCYCWHIAHTMAYQEMWGSRRRPFAQGCLEVVLIIKDGGMANVTFGCLYQPLLYLLVKNTGIAMFGQANVISKPKAVSPTVANQLPMESPSVGHKC